MQVQNAPNLIEVSPAPLVFSPNPAYLADIHDDATLADNQGKRIGILIVTYNAVTTLTKVLQRITPDVWNNVEEVAVFDDASQDATYELAVGLKTLTQLQKLHVLKHPKNLGYGGNQKAGYQYFMDKGFDVVILLHGDGQYAPEVLSHIYHPIVTGKADAVFGSRMMSVYGGPLKGGMPLYKYVGNRILSEFENRALGMSLTEFHSGYRAYNLHALRQIRFDKMTDDFHFDTEIIIKLNHQNYRITEVPIPTYYGTELCYVNGLKYARDVFHAVRRYRATIEGREKCPEFEEYFVPYPIKKSKDSSHDYARRLVGADQDVLDLGCGPGFLARELAANGNRVTGVDSWPEPLEADVFQQYFQADLEDGIGRVIEELRNQKFTRVLLLDVLEHLRHPEQLLGQCHDVLTREGEVVISLPNIANITIRLMLLFGRFEYQQRGLLDRTHLRFFTRKTARRFIEESGFVILQERATVMPVELALGLDANGLVARMLNRMLSIVTWMMPGLFGYQFVYTARSATHV